MKNIYHKLVNDEGISLIFHRNVEKVRFIFKHTTPSVSPLDPLMGPDPHVGNRSRLVGLPRNIYILNTSH